VQFRRVSGLSVASEIALPRLIAGAPERVSEVTIRRGPVPDHLPESTAAGPTWEIAGKQFLMRIPDIARFLLNDGSEIVVAPESDVALADIPIFILGKPRPTIVMIAHRDESLSSCDRIVRLQHGKIVADTPARAT